MNKIPTTRISDQECFEIALDSVMNGCNNLRQHQKFGWSRPTLIKLKREERYMTAVERIREKAFSNFLDGVL